KLLPVLVDYSTAFTYIRDGKAVAGLFSLRVARLFCMQRGRHMRIETVVLCRAPLTGCWK
ncbi:MAG: hypothetical protein NWQ21_10215, partial [Desulfobacterales bacterium]|nr:hypothetical protein [Desulfobacterales bacterium]